MANGTHEYAKLLGTGKATGSIVKVCNTHISADLVITDHSMGIFKGTMGSDGSVVDINALPNRSFGSSTTDLTAGDVTAGGASCIEGPFISVNVSAGSAIIYWNGELALVGA